LEFVDRSRFLAYAARATRGPTIDDARRRRAAKRGGGLQITLDNEEPPSADVLRTSEEFARLGDALNDLAKLEPALAELVLHHESSSSEKSRAWSVEGASAPAWR
jgi:hypothetical protein